MIQTYTQLMASINNEIERKKADEEWYKFKVKQIASRSVPKPI